MLNSNAQFLPSHRSLFLLWLVFLIPAVAGAQAPDSLSFQGYLTNSAGIAVNTTVSMTFKLYRDGTAVWTEVHPTVSVQNGVFNVLLGGTTPLDTMAFNAPLELGIKVGSDAEISPRTPLAAAAYAKALPGLYTFYYEDVDSQGYNVVGGSENNIIGTGVAGATIGGGGGISFGFPVPNSVLGVWGTVGGGRSNAAGGRQATIGGGKGNTASHDHTTIGGGSQNTAGYDYATVGGGWNNTTEGLSATIGGGWKNTATGQNATIPGGQFNRALGYTSFAAGYRAVAGHEGTFVWNDRSITSGDSLESTGSNQFLIRAAGGVGIGTNAPSTRLHVYGPGSDVGGVTPFVEVVARVQGPANTAIAIDAPTGNDPLLYFSNNGSGIWSLRNDAPSNVFQLRRPGATPTVVVELKRETDASWMRPGVDNTLDLGTSDLRWKAVYAAGGLITTSDRRLKRDIQPLYHGLNDVLALNPVSYRWNDGPDVGTRLGLIAQEASEVIPEVVVAPENEKGHYGLRYAELVPVLIKAIQEQQEIIAKLTGRVTTLEAAMGSR